MTSQPKTFECMQDDESLKRHLEKVHNRFYSGVLTRKESCEPKYAHGEDGFALNMERMGYQS